MIVYIMFFLDASEEAVIVYVIIDFVHLLQYSLSSDHDTLTAAVPVLKHCRGPDLLWGSHYSHHNDTDARNTAQGDPVRTPHLTST